MTREVFASSFADPGDYARYLRAKANGLSDHEAFKVGDNCVGCWGDSTKAGTGPSVAIPPEHMIMQFGSVAAARHKPVRVTYNGRSVVALIKDEMPHLVNDMNAARIDMNPDTCAALGLKPPVMVRVSYTFL